MKFKFKLPKLKLPKLKRSKKPPRDSKGIKGSLKTRLAAFFILMAIIPLVVMGTVVTNITRNSVSTEIQDKASIIVNNLDDNIDLFIEQNKNLVAFLATTTTVRTMEEQQISPFLYDMFQQNPQILRIYVAGIEDHSVFAVPFVSFPDNYNLENEKWYTGAIGAKG
ncbi:MAG: methyl-accepting chemotaxis protein, partial [Tepidanaerobacteraceae bacterium]